MTQTIRLFALISAILFASAAAEHPRGIPPWERIAPARALLNGASAQTGAIRLTLPTVTQEAGSVPLAVAIESPMTPEDHIEILYLFASGNPLPEIAEFRFAPRAGRAHLNTRIRLDGSQTVVALARTSKGQWLAAAQEVRVTVSGCGPAQTDLSSDQIMQTRIRVPDRLQPGAIGDVRTLIMHPMETGLRTGADGQSIPQRIIRDFRAVFEGEPVVEARLYRAISANPFLHFHIAPERSGTLVFHWEEDTGRRVSATAKIRVP